MYSLMQALTSGAVAKAAWRTGGGARQVCVHRALSSTSAKRHSSLRRRKGWSHRAKPLCNLSLLTASPSVQRMPCGGSDKCRTARGLLRCTGPCSGVRTRQKNPRQRIAAFHERETDSSNGTTALHQRTARTMDLFLECVVKSSSNDAPLYLPEL
ncbi:hypothetical protein ABL78_8458 [Leptomonas seymouri]|uniref:Uncharacterized protein n=1 Tax=Leptomonas seymouri TaxID=5684 RepID=A0A0N1HSN0_LEPSE|nr:hypothetical protein ABL78_8458 [Leptomonas seymouri]|eukprot:KPI82532.1 hypothetical protein ABL78_8458 [Leptomonas seymouri]